MNICWLEKTNTGGIRTIRLTQALNGNTRLDKIRVQ